MSNRSPDTFARSMSNAKRFRMGGIRRLWTDAAVWLLVVVFSVGIPISAPAHGRAPREQDRSAEVPSQRVDVYGDPLPPGAIARVGTIRFRQFANSNPRWSPDGKVLATTGAEGIAVWEVASGKRRKTLRPRQGRITQIEWSPDGKVLAFGGPSENLIYMWFPDTDETKTLQGPSPVYSIRWAPDGKRLATNNAHGQVRLWDPVAGRVVFTPPQKSGGIIHWSPNSKRLIIGSLNNPPVQIDLWNVIEGKAIQRLKVYSGYRITWSPDSKYFAGLVGRRQIGLWHANSGKPFRTFQIEDGTGDIKDIAWSPDGKVLAAGFVGPVVYLLDPFTGKTLRQLRPTKGTASSYYLSLRWSPDGKTLATITKNRIHLWNPTTARMIRTITVPHNLILKLHGNISWSPDWNTVAVCATGAILLYDVATGKAASPAAENAAPVDILHWSGNRLMTARSRTKMLQICDPATGKPKQTFNLGEAKNWHITWSPDGTTFVTTDGQKQIRVWDSATGKISKTLTADSRVWSLSWSPDGRTLASTVPDGIRLWDVLTEKPLRKFSRTAPRIYGSVFWSPNGKKLVSVDSDKRMRVWETASGQLAWEICPPQPQQRPLLASWSPDNKTLAIMFSDSKRHSVYLYEVATRQPISTYDLPLDAQTLRWSPDGRILAAGEGSDVKLINVGTGKVLRKLTGHMERIVSLSWSPDGTKIASGSDDTTALIWDVSGIRQDQPEALTELGLQESWEDLADGDAKKAYQALWKLVASGDRAVDFLDQKLKPAQIDTRRIAQWIADLDNTSFQRRQEATNALVELAEAAKPALEKVLAGKPSLEVRRRVEKILDTIRSKTLTGDRLRIWRSLQVLEYVGSPRAEQVLKRMASGADGHLFTDEARAALRRLAKLRSLR
ncbi:MAG: hypothetical protein KatS3mg105_1902 [Gemmatales bacterium]|nr:MAG: hypothetical protein KatS3mg105_1902 [Gemmatales bacterium]